MKYVGEQRELNGLKALSAWENIATQKTNLDCSKEGSGQEKKKIIVIFSERKKRVYVKK